MHATQIKVFTLIFSLCCFHILKNSFRPLTEGKVVVHNLPPPAQVKRLLKIKPSSGSNGGGCFIFSSEVKKVTMDTFGRLNQLFGTRGSIPETWKSKVTSGLHTLSPTISLIQSTQLFSSLFPCSCSSLINNGSFLFPPPPLCRNYTQGLLVLTIISHLLINILDMDTYANLKSLPVPTEILVFLF